MSLLFPATLDDTHEFTAIAKIAGIRETSNWADRFGSFLSSQMSSDEAHKIRTLSLFSGAGGLDIGFHDVGFDIVQHVEIEPRFARTLLANREAGYYESTSEITVADVAKVGECIPLVTKNIDLIIGGPPCQPFSAAGRRANGTPGTTRGDGQLFKEYIRLLNICQPAAFVFENVYGITGSQAGEAWNDITEGFRDCGYDLSFRILDSADYGVPQHRERMFIVGTRHSTFLFPRPTHGPDSTGSHPYYTPLKALEKTFVDTADPELEIGGSYGSLMPEIPPGLNYSFFTEKMGNPKALFAWRSKFSDFLYKADPNRPVRTIKAQAGKYTGPFHWDSRRFSSAELKRLQSFPDSYILDGSKTVIGKQIGNSVPPQIARIIALAVAEQVFNISAPFKMGLLHQGERLGFRTRKRAFSDEYFAIGRAALERIGKSHKTLKLADLASMGRVDDKFSMSFGKAGAAHLSASIDEGRLVIKSGRCLKKSVSATIELICIDLSSFGFNFP